MSFVKSTEQIQELCESILYDIPKVMKNNKSAAQRIRTSSIKLSKLAKTWRKLSLEQERKSLKKKKTKESRRKKS